MDANCGCQLHEFCKTCDPKRYAEFLLLVPSASPEKKKKMTTWHWRCTSCGAAGEVTDPAVRDDDTIAREVAARMHCCPVGAAIELNPSIIRRTTAARTTHMKSSKSLTRGSSDSRLATLSNTLHAPAKRRRTATFKISKRLRFTWLTK
jgi:predicted nucleic acid-binding Zn ribbon protein